MKCLRMVGADTLSDSAIHPDRLVRAKGRRTRGITIARCFVEAGRCDKAWTIIHFIIQNSARPGMSIVPAYIYPAVTVFSSTHHHPNNAIVHAYIAAACESHRARECAASRHRVLRRGHRFPFGSRAPAAAAHAVMVSGNCSCAHSVARSSPYRLADDLGFVSAMDHSRYVCL